MATIAGFGAALYAASGSSTAMTTEAMTDSGDHTTYTVTNAAHRYWDDTVAVTVQESTDSGSTWHTAPVAPTVQYVGGKITFPSARNAAYLYRINAGAYFTITQIGGGHNWDLTVDSDLLDATEFGQGFHTFVDGPNQGSATIGRFYVDTYFTTLLLSGTGRLVLALYTNSSTGQRYEGYAFIKQHQLKTAETALVDATIQFTLDKTFYYNPGP